MVASLKRPFFTLFVLKEDYVTTPDDTLMLHAYPNDLKVLQGTVVDIKVKATDNNSDVTVTKDIAITISKKTI